MIRLDRLLDGIEVAIDPLAWTSAVATRCRPPLAGTGVIELAGGIVLRVSRERVILVPWRRGARAVAVSAEASGERGDPDVLVACGRATYRGSVGLFDHLREPLVEAVSGDDPIHRSFEDLLEEIAAQRPGRRAMVEALLRRCLILLCRRWWEHGRCGPSWLAALEDARLGHAVAAMQDRPQQRFTLPALAQVAGMSRSVFAARFADAVGESPIEFLKTLRLTRAADLLTRTDLPVKSVAAQVGYSSRSAFSRAFVAHHGIGPTRFRMGAPPPGLDPASSGTAAEVEAAPRGQPDERRAVDETRVA
jgi:AraC-like DNA-binding protein